MPKPSHSQIAQLLRDLIVPFHLIFRDSNIPIGKQRPENDAEHSWSLAVLACSLAPEIDSTLDTGKVCQFAVAHDLLEVYAGDTSVFAGSKHCATKAIREEKALQRLAK